VDNLLSSPHFGEKWASMWLDLARYADSKGFERDPHRSIFPYRDYVIKAFNADLPYNQFITEQLAGDLLPNPTDEQLIATGFHRNTTTNDEGGTNNEEYRVAAVLDDEIAHFLKTWQPTIYSLDTDSLVNAALYDTKFLGFRQNGQAIIRNVTLTGKDKLIIKILNSKKGGTLI